MWIFVVSICIILTLTRVADRSMDTAWYYGNITREEAEALLTADGEDGCVFSAESILAGKCDDFLASEFSRWPRD